MSIVAALPRRRFVLLALILAAVTAALVLAPPLPATSLVCNPANGQCPGTYVIYYNNAQHDKVVGECSCGECTGEMTDFSSGHSICCGC